MTSTRGQSGQRRAGRAPGESHLTWFRRHGRALACLPLLMTGCGRPPVATGHAGGSTVPRVTGASSTVASSVPASPAPSTRPSKCAAFPSGFRGRVFGLPVLARLEHTGDAVRGRYFYEKVGVDIALAGTLSPDGVLAMAEGPPQAPSGRFEGTCDGLTGALEGTWTSPSGKSAPFALAPIPPTYPPIVATKHWALRTAGYDVKETKLEFFGLPSPAAERAIGSAGVEPDPGPWMFKDEFPKGGSGSGEYGEQVVRVDRELVNVSRGGTMYMTGAAHPINGYGLAWNTYDLRTGRVVTSADVFTRDPRSIAVACAANGPFGRAMGEGQDPNAVWDGVLHSDTFTLEDNGAQFYAMGFPHAWGYLDGNGPRLPYSVLLRDGYLRPDSPVARAWAGVAPARAGDVACPPGKESTWWSDPNAEPAAPR